MLRGLSWPWSSDQKMNNRESTPASYNTISVWDDHGSLEQQEAAFASAFLPEETRKADSSRRTGLLLQHPQSKREGGMSERSKRADPAQLCFLLLHHSYNFQKNNHISTLSYSSVSNTTNKSNLKAIRPRQIHPQLKTRDT